MSSCLMIVADRFCKGCVKNNLIYYFDYEHVYDSNAKNIGDRSSEIVSTRRIHIKLLMGPHREEIKGGILDTVLSPYKNNLGTGNTALI